MGAIARRPCTSPSGAGNPASRKADWRPARSQSGRRGQCRNYKFLKHYERDLPGLFIVSQVELKEVHHLPQSPDFKVSVTKAEGIKCERCWNYRTTVGEDSVHPTLCDRCCGAITENA